MKKHLQLILALLCILALAFGISAAAAEETESRDVSVKWVDGDNYDNLRKSIEATLSYSDSLGSHSVSVTLTEENGWAGTVLVPVGAEATWSSTKIDGYAVTVSAPKTGITLLTYTHAVAPNIDKKAVIEWNDNNNAKGIRPSSVALLLYADDEPCGEPKAGLAAVTWEDLRPYKPNSTTPIRYTVKPQSVPAGYTAECSGMKVTFTLNTIDLSVSATIAGAPEGTDLSALRLVLDGPEPGLPKTLTYEDVVGGYKLDGVLPGAYLIRDINADTLVEGYTMDAENSKVCDAVYVAEGSGALAWKYTYKEPEAIEDMEEDYDPWTNTGSLTFQILGPGTDKTVTYAEFVDNKYEMKNLRPGVYTVVERNAEKLVKYYTLTSDSVTAVKLEVTADGKTAKATLQNFYAPAPTPEPDAEFVDVPVTKTWNDGNDKDGNRPASVTVRLYADGVEVNSHVLTAAEGWKYTFAELPRYQEDNKTEIVYSVNEDNVPMYSKEINGYNLTNHYLPEVTSRSVAKVWEDKNNEQRTRPSSIVMTLFNGRESVATVILSNANNWTATVDNLPTVVDGKQAVYSWKEQAVLGYKLVEVVEKDGTMIFYNTTWTRPDKPTAGKKPRTPGKPVETLSEYETPLGVEVIINHVGDCFD